MSLRRRITIAAAAAVAVAVVLASLLTYVLVRNQLIGQLDGQLRQRIPSAPFEIGEGVPLSRLRLSLHTNPVRPGEAPPIVQLVNLSGTSKHVIDTTVMLPVPSAVNALARKGSGSVYFDTFVKNEHIRVYAIGRGVGHALEVARSLADIDTVLERIRLVLLALAVGGIALAALLGRFVAGTALAPVRRLTEAAEHVADTQDLGQRIDGMGRDELGRLASSFNGMLDALEKSMQALNDSARAQRQLVADASHELRTPVTSLRTNIEILESAAQLEPGDYQRLIGDVVQQLEELSALVGDLIELARDDERTEPPEDIRLDILVSEAIERAQLHAPTAQFETQLLETLVSGVPARLDRAVNNLLDNAVKFAGTAAPIEVLVRDGELRICDHGPGITADELPHVFDRFYRGVDARAEPGSGLGLAIVRQVAQSHGGSVAAEPTQGGGVTFTLKIPEAA